MKARTLMFALSAAATMSVMTAHAQEIPVVLPPIDPGPVIIIDPVPGPIEITTPPPTDIVDPPVTALPDITPEPTPFIDEPIDVTTPVPEPTDCDDCSSVE